MLKFFAIALVLAVAYSSDKITNLPGAPSLNFDQYAGYVTVDESHGRALFYWFVESQNDPSTDPIVLWLNGGPGCSSLGGLMTENGPFRPLENGTLMINPYSWNKIANVIYLESPAGVGFSYSNTTSDYTTGDARTANDSYNFLQGFFKRYPQYQGREFWVSGESYGGHYVPELTARIVKGNDNNEGIQINIQGFMVGNAWTDAPVDNAGAVFYWWSHALISDNTFKGINDNCDFADIGPLAKRQAGGNPTLCNEFLGNSTYEMGSIDIYDIYVNVCRKQKEMRYAAAMGQAGSTVHKAYAQRLGEPIFPPYYPCEDAFVQTYLNRQDVQQAIHANMNLGYQWTDCSPRINYNYTNLLASVVPLYEQFKAGGKIRALVYSGDVDAIVPYSGSRQWIANLGWTTKEAWRPWADSNDQVGGYIQVLDGLTFSTVRGAGHMVPEWQPDRAYVMFSHFLQNKPFPPPPK